MTEITKSKSSDNSNKVFILHTYTKSIDNYNF